MGWNYRVLAHECSPEEGIDVYMQLHEVYYKEDVPDSYTVNSVSIGSENIKGMNWQLNKMKLALKKPILWAGDRWPEEYKPLK